MCWMRDSSSRSNCKFSRPHEHQGQGHNHDSLINQSDLMHRSEYMYQIRVIQKGNTHTEEHKNMLKMK